MAARTVRSEQQQRDETATQSRGVNAIIVLAVLTVIEYIAAVMSDSMALVVPLLVVFALAKAWVIFVYFMHISKLWRGEEAH